VRVDDAGTAWTAGVQRRPHALPSPRTASGGAEWQQQRFAPG
jgi:hypothetical protein